MISGSSGFRRIRADLCRLEGQRSGCMGYTSYGHHRAPLWTKYLSGSTRCRAKLNHLDLTRTPFHLVGGGNSSGSFPRFLPFDILPDTDANIYDWSRAIYRGERPGRAWTSLLLTDLLQNLKIGVESPVNILWCSRPNMNRNPLLLIHYCL